MDKKEFLKILSEELHKPVRQNFERRKVIIKGGVDDTHTIDLSSMLEWKNENDGYCYILVCMDVLSRYAWLIPQKTKTV
jgi:hypothetical protein